MGTKLPKPINPHAVTKIPEVGVTGFRHGLFQINAATVATAFPVAPDPLGIGQPEKAWITDCAANIRKTRIEPRQAHHGLNG